jgi:hypothetical protein
VIWADLDSYSRATAIQSMFDRADTIFRAAVTVVHVFVKIARVTRKMVLLGRAETKMPFHTELAVSCCFCYLAHSYCRVISQMSASFICRP